MGTLPILLFFVGENNVMGILANLLIVPLVPVITIGGFVGLGAANLSGWNWILEPIKWLLDLMFWVSDWAVRYALVIEVKTMWIKWLIVLVMGALVWVVVKILQERSEEK